MKKLLIVILVLTQFSNVALYAQQLTTRNQKAVPPRKVPFNQLSNFVNDCDSIAIACYISDPNTPTTASVPFSGGILAFKWRGISITCVSITNQNDETHAALTNPFGYYRFNEIPAGETYIISVAHRRYQFINNPRILTILDEISELGFTAEP